MVEKDCLDSLISPCAAFHIVLEFCGCCTGIWMLYQVFSNVQQYGLHADTATIVSLLGVGTVGFGLITVLETCLAYFSVIPCLGHQARTNLFICILRGVFYALAFPMTAGMIMFVEMDAKPLSTFHEDSFNPN